MRRLVGALTVLACTVGAADGAHAGTATGRPATFTAAPREQNHLTVDQGIGGRVQFADAGRVVIPGLWCIPIPLGEVGCDPDADPRDTDGGEVTVDLGDGDDLATVRWIPGTDARPGSIRATGGAGTDLIENSFDGAIRFEGGEGDDALVTGATASGYLLGGTGADLMDARGACCAVAGYEDHGAGGVRVTLDGERNDGAAGERDDVRTTGVAGSPGSDVIVGDARANTLSGSGGADRIDGAGGDDRIDATLRDAPAGHGADGVDTVRCGDGDDDVVADENDKVAVDCERIRVEPAVSLALAIAVRTVRVSRAGSVRMTYRFSPPALGGPTSRNTFRLVDRNGRAASSTAAFLLGASSAEARVRVRLRRATRRRLARSRSGELRLFAQRVSRDADAASAASGYEIGNIAVRIRRAKR
jgi:hypothetical protein